MLRSGDLDQRLFEKARTISNFANGEIHGGNSGIARIGYKFGRKLRFIGNNRFKTARAAESIYDYRAGVLIRLKPGKANYAGRAGAAACASSPARIPLGH
jgi:hypothetical protein